MLDKMFKEPVSCSRCMCICELSEVTFPCEYDSTYGICKGCNETKARGLWSLDEGVE
jgi:hypothetical protein